MNILQYVKNLLPSFSRDTVLDDLTRLHASIGGALLPHLAKAQKAFHGQELKSGLAQSFQASLQSTFRMPHSGLFDILHAIFEPVPAQLDALEKFVEDQFAKDQTKEALTYRRATVLKYSELLYFASDYAHRWLLRVLAAEAAVASGHPDAVDGQLTQNEKADFEATYQPWLAALGAISIEAKQLMSALETVPDVIVDEKNNGVVAATVGARNLDPLKLQFLTPRLNPIYHIGMMLAEWDVAAISRAKEEKIIVELRLHELQNARTGTPNPRVEDQIQKAEDRLRKINFRIRKLADEV